MRLFNRFKERIESRRNYFDWMYGIFKKSRGVENLFKNTIFQYEHKLIAANHKIIINDDFS